MVIYTMDFHIFQVQFTCSDFFCNAKSCYPVFFGDVSCNFHHCELEPAIGRHPERLSQDALHFVAVHMQTSPFIASSMKLCYTLV